MRLAFGYQLKSKLAFWSILKGLLGMSPVDVMLSFSEFQRSDPRKAVKEMEAHFADFQGRILLDNGAYGVEAIHWRCHSRRYLHFVGYTEGIVNWRPVPFDFIPGRHRGNVMCTEMMKFCERFNLRLVGREFVPIVHLGCSFERVLEKLLSSASPTNFAN
jgi:hypothetical protein